MDGYRRGRHSPRQDRSGDRHKRNGKVSLPKYDLDILSTKWTSLKEIPVHGDNIKIKYEEDVRIYFENVDGFQLKPKNRLENNLKIKYFNTLMKKLEVDIYGGVECQTQWDLVPHSHSLRKVMDLRDGAQCCRSFNKHEKFGVRQQGGTFLVADQWVSTHLRDAGVDSSGLGRWSWMRFEGNCITTRVIIAYQPCQTRKTSTESTMAQQRRYWRLQGNRKNPRALFVRDLCNSLLQWRNQGEKLLLILDANEDLCCGRLSRALENEDLGMKDIIAQRTGLPGPATFIRGQRQIDGAWATPDLMINAAAFLPFHFGIGDHRPILVDIPISSLVGGEIRRISRPTARRLKCNQNVVARKYCDALEIYLIKHRVQEKLDRLSSPNLSTKEKWHTLELLDRVIGDGMRMAEKRCRKLPMGEIPYCPALAQAGLRLRLWSLVLKKKKGYNINTRRIRIMGKQCNLENVLNVSEDEVKQHITKARSHYSSIKGQASKLRSAFLVDKAENALSSKAQKEITNIRRNEECRSSWRTINSGRGKVANKGISEVEVRKGNEWKKITNREEVEQAIMENNSKRFQLAADTPLMQPHATKLLGFLSNSPFAQDILNGIDIDMSQFDGYTNDFFKYIGSRQQLPALPNEVKVEDFHSYWRGAREKTSSSMSGRHFGHYKAAVLSPIISKVHASVGHICSVNGIYLSRWTSGLSVMLEKIEDVIKVDKLRAILLMEADFNFLNKLHFGHRLVHQCETNKRFPEELYGGRGNRDAGVVSVNRRLSIDYMKQTREGGALVGVDAAQCYDRIVHSLAILLCRNEGLTMSPMLLMFGAIQSMNFYLRTTFGESDTSYGGWREIPFQGSCQGNGASPAIWLVISMYLVLLMKEKGHGSILETAFTGVIYSFIGFLFVDDTDLIIIPKPGETSQEVHNRLQAAVTYWNGILGVTGGALRPEKCYWYMLEYIWENGIPSLVQDKHNEIVLPLADGGVTPIIEKAPDEAVEAVGVWQSVDGGKNTQLEVLNKKIQAVHQSLEKHPLPRHLAWIGLRQAVWKTVEYVLPAMKLSFKEAHSLAKELYRPLLPMLGCNRNFPLCLRYNPPHLMGLGLRDPYVEQGIGKLQVLMSQGGHNSITGHLIQTIFEHHQLEVGTLTSMFQLAFKDWAYLTTHSWLIDIWEFIDRKEIKLHHNELNLPTKQRENDASIMEAIRALGPLSRKEIMAINRVRCYFQVMTVADIASGDGKRISKNYINNNSKPFRSKWKWHVEHPSNADFNIWHKRIQCLTDHRGNLHQPLGQWYVKPHIEDRWYYSQSTDAVYLKQKEVWKIFYRSAKSTRNSQRFDLFSCSNISPHNIVPTTAYYTDQTVIYCEGYVLGTPAELLLPSISETEETNWVLRESNISQELHSTWMLKGLINGSLCCIADGSYKPTQDANAIAAAFIITDGTNHRIWGKSAIQGQKASSYRAELLGIFAVISAIKVIETNNSTYTGGQLKVGCDNKLAGKRSSQTDARVSPQMTNADIVRSIRRMQWELKTDIKFFHVHGHQDEHASLGMLTKEARLNVEVDSLAQSHLEECIITRKFHTQPCFNREGWTVWLGGVKLQDSVGYHIRDWIGRHNLREYLYNRGLIAWTTFQLIDFSPLETYLKFQSQAFRLWFTKHWTNFCGIGKQMKRMKLWKDDKCPCCKKVVESSTIHLFRCDNTIIKEARENGFKQILEWLEEVHTAPLLLQVIKAFWYGQSPQLDPYDPWVYRKMYGILRDLGVASMWMGLLPKDMVEEQERHYKLLGSRRSGKRWASTLVGKMLRVSHKLWLKRNNLLHLTDLNGVHGITLIELRKLV